MPRSNAETHGSLQACGCPRFSRSGQSGAVRFTSARETRWSASVQKTGSGGTTSAVAGWLPPRCSSDPAAAAWELGDAGELLVGADSPLVRSTRRAVHGVERLEHRLQRQAAALPLGVRRLLAGALAGAAGKTATAPLETVRMQLLQSGSTTAWGAAAATWRRGGAAAFFRGNSLDVLRTIPSRSTELATYEFLKKVLRRWNRSHTGELHIPDQLIATLAGGMAGAFASTVVHPLETVRTRLALGATHGGFGGVLAEVVRTEGLPALYKYVQGLDASLVGVVPYAAIRLASYDFFKTVWRRSTGRKDIDPQAALVFGAVAGVVSAAATFPLEVTRRRMMAGAAYPNFAAALVTIARVEGVPALFNGLLFSLTKQGPAVAITMAAFEMAKHYLEV